MSQLAAAEDVPSRFLDLPAELRDYIYSELYPKQSVKLTRRMEKDYFGFCPLAHTNRQLRQEVLLIYHLAIMTVIRIAGQHVFKDFFLMSRSIQLDAEAITLDIRGASNITLCVDVFPLLKALVETPTRTFNVESKIPPWSEVFEGGPRENAEIEALLEGAAREYEDLLNKFVAPPTSYNTKKRSKILGQ